MEIQAPVSLVDMDFLFLRLRDWVLNCAILTNFLEEGGQLTISGLKWLELPSIQLPIVAESSSYCEPLKSSEEDGI